MKIAISKHKTIRLHDYIHPHVNEGGIECITFIDTWNYILSKAWTLTEAEEIVNITTTQSLVHPVISDVIRHQSQELLYIT